MERRLTATAQFSVAFNERLVCAAVQALKQNPGSDPTLRPVP